MSLLELRDVHSYYGNIHALKGISINVDEGEIVTLIGTNGAGKTTTLRTISGVLKPRHGSVRFAGEDLVPYKMHEIVHKGIAMVPEGRRIFSRLTVYENLDMGAFIRKDGKKRHVEASVSLIKDSNGKGTGFRGILRDVTHRRNAEKALRESEERYRTILDSIEEAYFEVDLAGNFTFFNDSLAKNSGYSKSELLKMSNRDFMPPEASKQIS